MRDREKERGRQTDRDTEREERGLCIIAQFFKNQVILKIHNLLVNIKIKICSPNKNSLIELVLFLIK